MSIKSANKPQAPVLLPPATAETASLVPIMSTVSSGLVSLSTTSTYSSPSSSSSSSSLSSCIDAAATVSTTAAPMQNVLVYVGNDHYAHAYTVHTPPLPHNSTAPPTYQLQQQQQQQHLQSPVAGGCGTAKTQSFYPSGTTYLQNVNRYKPLTAADQNLVRYLVSTTDSATDNTNSYVTVVGNSNSQIVLNRCDSIKSESPCSSLSSSEDQIALPPNSYEHQQSLMGFDSNRSNNNGSITNIGVTVTSGGRVVPVHATVAPPLQSQLPPGTVADIGGNIISGTVTVAVPVTAASAQTSLNGNFVTIPYGWKRLISNDVIIYISPSNIVLTSAEQVKDYLQTAGTCKCGLECPFHYESTFNFDLKVIGKPSLLTPDINVDLTKLCNHKRKLQTLASLDAKMVDPMNNFQKDYGGLKKKPKVNNKKLVKATTATAATTTMPPYNSAATTTAATTTTGVANNNAAILHPLDKNLCSITNHAVGGPEFAQQQQSQQYWPNQFVMHPSTTQKLPSTSQPMFNNMIDPQSYYRYSQQSAIGQQHHQIFAPQGAELMHRYQSPQQQGQLPSACFMTAATTTTNASGDLTSLQIPGLTTTNANTHPCMVPQMPSQNQMVLSAARNGNHLLSGQPTVEQSGPGRPPIPNNLPHPTALPNNIRLPHPVCYDSTASKQQQTPGTRLPVPYPNAVPHINGMRLLPKQQWNNGAVAGGIMRCPPPPPHQQHNGNIFERVPPLPQHLPAASMPPVWPEEVATVRKKPASKSNPSRIQKKQRPNYHLLVDPQQQQQQPCPNVDVRQMSGQSNQQQQQHNLVQQHGFNSSISSTEGNGTNGMLATASPSFIDDPSGYLAQQTALLNSTISGQGLQMNGFPCNTPPPLIHPDSLRTTASTTTSSDATKQPLSYQQHHRSTNKQQHFSGGQVFVTHQQALQLQQQQQQQQQQLQQVVVNRGIVTIESRPNELLEGDQQQLQGRCTDCLISGQDLHQQQQLAGNKRNYSRSSGRGELSTAAGSIGINEDPVTSSTFFDQPPHNTPTCSSTSSSKSTNSTMSSNHGSRPLSRQLPPPSPSVSSPDNRPIQGGTISTSNVSPHHDTSSNSSTGSIVANATGIASPPHQQHQQIVMSKVNQSPQQSITNINGTTPRICMTTMASNMATIANGVRTLQTQALPIITSPITLTTRAGAAQLPHQFHLAASPQQQHQQLVALATAATSASNVCNGTTAVVVSSGANGTLVAKSPLEMVQSVVIKSSPPNYQQQHPQHTTNALPPGHILVSSGGQLLMASTSAPLSAAQQQQTAHLAQQHHLMAPPPPKHQQQQLAMPPISVSPMVTNVTASVTQVIPTVAQQVLGQQTVLVNALQTPSFLLQPGVTMTMDGLANLQQIPHLLTANGLLQHHHPNHAAATAALLSPTQDILSALAKNNNGATSPGSAVVSTANGKKGKKRKSGGGQVSTSTPNGTVTSIPGGLVAQPVTNMLHIAAAAGNGGAGVVSPQNFAPQLQMHSPQTSVMQALTIVPGKGGGPPQLVMNASPAQTATQHINLLQPVNLLNNTTGVHIQNYPTIQQFILPNLGGMVVNADGTATILPATATTSPAQATADASHHTHAQPVQMQLQLQNVNGQNVLTPIPHSGGHITFSSPPTHNPSGLSMLIRPAITKQPTHHASPVLHHSPPTTAQFLSPNGSATGATGPGQQFVVNGTTFTSGQLSPLITAAGISPRAANATNAGDYGQATLMVPCTPVSSNGGNTYVHQNTTIVQQQTTMVTNNGQSQPVSRAGHTHNINLRPAPSQHTTTLNVNLNEQNQFIISDKSLILQTQAQAQLQQQQQQQQQQQIQQQLQQARQQLNINQTVNLNLISHAAAAAAAQQYRQCVSTQTATGLHQVPTTVTTSNTFCQTSNASSRSSGSVGAPQASTTPPTPGSPPDTTTLSPLAPQPNNHIPSNDNLAGQVMGGSGTTIVVASPMGNVGHSNSNSVYIGGGQSPMAGADTTTYSMGSGHSTDDGLSPAPSNCSSVGAGSSGSYAVTSGSSTAQLMVDNALSVVNRGNGAHSGQQQGSMAMVHCVSSSEPDAPEFTLIDQLDWSKNSFSLPNQNQYNQRSTKKNQKNIIAAPPYAENATIKYDMENKPSDGRRTYSNPNLSKSSIDLFQYGNQQHLNQRQTTTLNYPESASTVQYVTGNNSNDATETIIVQSNYNDNPQRNIQQRSYNSNNQTASTVVLDHIGGSYANNIVEELLKQQQLEALQPNHQPHKMQPQQPDHLLVNNSRSRYEKLHQQQQQRRKLQKQQQINNIRQTIAALFDDDDDATNEVSTTKDTIQSAIDSVLSEECGQLEDTEPNTKVDSIPVRSFAVGDLIWAPAYGCPAWPGQVIATANQLTNTDIQLVAGHVLIRWFGDSGTATTSSVAADTLCTLTQGLELHHLVRKRARTSRKLNSQLEKAIQQAMIELDKMSDSAGENCSAKFTIVDSSQEKLKKGVNTVGANKDMTIVKKSSSRLRSQR